MVKIDIDMPNSCKDCRFKKHISYEFWGCIINQDIAIYDDLVYFSSKRHPNCPLVEFKEGE